MGYGGVSTTRVPLTGWPVASVRRTDPFQSTVSFTTLKTMTLSPGSTPRPPPYLPPQDTREDW
jgi:hypothetical protein